MRHIKEKSAGISARKEFSNLYFKIKTYRYIFCLAIVLDIISIPTFLNAQNTWADKLGFPSG
jgi:hypothetical protein